MSEENLASLNLNLLVALHALLETTSVTAAARRLGVTQSAASRSLGQLRTLLEDPLLVRQGSGMVPTPRALALAGPLRSALDQVRIALRAGVPFDPARQTRRFTVASADLIAPLLLPALTAHWPATLGLDWAPLRVPSLVEDLASGRVDLALGPALDRSGLSCVPLSSEPFAVALRRGHPATTLDLDAYTALGHVLVSPLDEDDRSVVGKALRALGRTRHVALRVPGFLQAPWALLDSDLVLTAPRRLLERVAETLPIDVVDAPLDLPPLSVNALWHDRWEADPAHRWLRAQVEAAWSGRTQRG